MNVINTEIVKAGLSGPVYEIPVEDVLFTGSRAIYTNNDNFQAINVTEQSDEDYVILIPQTYLWQDVHSKLTAGGWTHGGSVPPEGSTAEFSSFKLNYISFDVEDRIINYIFVKDKKEFAKWKLATKIAKKFQPVDKDERILLFSAVFGAFIE